MSTAGARIAAALERIADALEAQNRQMAESAKQAIEEAAKLGAAMGQAIPHRIEVLPPRKILSGPPRCLLCGSDAIDPVSGICMVCVPAARD